MSPRPSAATLDFVAIGDAVVDVIATCDDAFLVEHDLPKGQMRLLTAGAADALHAAMAAPSETAGGSAANTAVGVAAMGGRAAFVGKVADDRLGTLFSADMAARGVRFDCRPTGVDQSTGRCLILVTPDAQRTMNTCPGASHALRAQDVDEALIGSAATLYLEGYLWGAEGPRGAMRRAVAIAREAGRQIAFTLSESVCIADRRDAFARMIDDRAIDLLFANEHEALQLTGRTGLDDALNDLAERVATVVVTRGPAGASAVEGGERIDIPAAPVARVVDTTGAGDLFAAGLLAARCRGAGLERQLTSGALAAAEIISHFGARPQADLRTILQH